MATAARLHEGAGRGVRQCCEEHARADVESALEQGRLRVHPLIVKEMKAEGVQHYHAMCPACRAEARRERPMVRGKFQVIEVAQVNWSKDTRKIKLQAVYDQTTEENRRYAKATPSGSIEMTIDNPPASDALALGKTFYVDFTPAE